jgi:hypothetical protein
VTIVTLDSQRFGCHRLDGNDCVRKRVWKKWVAIAEWLAHPLEESLTHIYVHSGDFGQFFNCKAQELSGFLSTQACCFGRPREFLGATRVACYLHFGSEAKEILIKASQFYSEAEDWITKNHPSLTK